MGRLTDAVVIVDDDGIADGHIRGAVDVPTIRVRSRAARVGNGANTGVTILAYEVFITSRSADLMFLYVTFVLWYTNWPRYGISIWPHGRWGENVDSSHYSRMITVQN